METECTCSASLARIDELCPVCLEAWEQWMETVAMPQLRKAMAEEEEIPHAA